VIDISPAERVPAGRGLFLGSDPGEAGGMQQSDRRTLVDDDSTTRPENGDARMQTAQVIRLLANPRRVRRA
jgi:hypothetical protein